MTKHTPGPICVDAGKACFLLTQDGYTPKPVGLAYSWGDARLFAAASDMLAVLKALEGSRLFSIDNEENRRVGSERYDLREMINAAIDKAEGKR